MKNPLLSQEEFINDLLRENYQLKKKVKELETENEHLQDRIEDLYEMITAEDEDD